MFIFERLVRLVNVATRISSQQSVAFSLATSHDLRFCKDSSREGELLRLVFTELLDAEYPRTERRLASLYHAFAAT